MALRRDWTAARRVHDGFPCRVCGRGFYGVDPWVELAHLLKDEKLDEIRRGPRGGKTAFVHPDSVVTMCRDHHRIYDAHELDLWDRLWPEERDWCVARVGEGEA